MSDNYYKDKEKTLIPLSFDYRRSHYDYQVMKELIDQIKDGAILHLGCSAGVSSCLMAELGAREIIGVDVYDEAIKKADKIWHNFSSQKGLIEDIVHFYNQDIRYLSVPIKASFVWAVDVIEHWREEDLPEIKQNIANHMDPCGVFYLHTPLGKDLFDPRHEVFYTPELLEKLWGDIFLIDKIWITPDGERNSQGKIVKQTCQRVNALLSVRLV